MKLKYALTVLSLTLVAALVLAIKAPKGDTKWQINVQGLNELVRLLMPNYSKTSWSESKIMAASEVDCARLAAFIDGEGSFIITPGSNGFLTLRIQVSNTDIRLCQWLERNFGGNVANIKPYKAIHKPSFLWATSCKAAELITIRIMPYLIIKKEQAEIAMAFRETFRQGRNQKNLLTTEEKAKREDFRQKLIVLHRKGTFEPINDVTSLNQKSSSCAACGKSYVPKFHGERGRFCSNICAELYKEASKAAS